MNASCLFKKILPALFIGVLMFYPMGAPAQTQQKTMQLTEDIRVPQPKLWELSARLRDSLELVRVSEERKGEREAQLLIVREVRQSHDEAVARLAQIAREIKSPIRSRFLLVEGWPALEQRYMAPFPRTG